MYWNDTSYLCIHGFNRVDAGRKWNSLALNVLNDDPSNRTLAIRYFRDMGIWNKNMTGVCKVVSISKFVINELCRRRSAHSGTYSYNLHSWLVSHTLRNVRAGFADDVLQLSDMLDTCRPSSFTSILRSNENICELVIQFSVNLHKYWTDVMKYSRILSFLLQTEISCNYLRKY